MNKKYQEQYDALINFALKQNRKKLKRTDSNFIYYENHHILPKCLGGTNDKENMVLLTYSEHLKAHWLLCKMNPNKFKLLIALSYMAGISKYRLKDITEADLNLIADAHSLYKNYTATHSFSVKMSKISKEYMNKPEHKKRLSLAAYKQWHDENGAFKLSGNKEKASKRISTMNKKNWSDSSFRKRRSMQVTSQLKNSWASENCPFRKPEYNATRQKGVIKNIYRKMLSYNLEPSDENWNDVCKKLSELSGARMSDLRKYEQITKYFGSVAKLKWEVRNDK